MMGYTDEHGENESAPTTTAREHAVRSVAAKDAAQDVLQDARGRSKEVVEKAAAQTREALQRFRQQGASSLDRSKGQLGAQIGSLARALHRGSEQLRRDDMGAFADVSEQVATQVEEVARYVQGRSGEALLRDLEGFARRRRALFVGSLLLTGVLAGRFLRPGRAETGRTYVARSDAAPRNTAPVREVRTVRAYRGGVDG